MQTQPEAPAGHRRLVHGTAFGLSLEVDPSIELDGITDAATPAPDLDASATHKLDTPAPERSTPSLAARPPTRVRLDPRELGRRWSRANQAPERMREMRDGSTVLLTVELAPPAGYLLHVPGFCRILIAPDGTELLCGPEPGCSEWATLLLSQALPLAATLRGLEVLHASGVVIQGRAALFAGPQGAGKSSLAAALLRGGAASLLSDDTVALESRGGALIAHPGTTVLHLRAAEHERLSAGERAALGPVTTVLDKWQYSPRASAAPAPFGGLFLLERGTHGPPLERIEAVDPFALLACTFNLSVRTPERLVRHLDLAATLAATKRVYRLRIQPGVNATQLAETLHEQLPGL